MPTSSRHCAIKAGESSMLTPNASITSAAPHLVVMPCAPTFGVELRLPCLATRTPAPATTNAVTVEMLNVPAASPPVPQVSTRASRPVPLASSTELLRTLIGVAAARIASAKPTISSTVSPFMCSPTSSAAICASVHLPESTSSITLRASSRESDSR